MPYFNIREEELKNRIAQDYFANFDSNKIIGNIDFCVASLHPTKNAGTSETESLLWAEAKKGKADSYKSIVQLILTIGKSKLYDKNLPPAYLGAFDSEKIAFIAYNAIHDVFYTNDFNWKVRPSDSKTKEFSLLLEKVSHIIDQNSLLFYFEKDSEDIKNFIKLNFVSGKSDTSKIRIDKNNFMVIYTKWLQMVKPSIVVDWAILKKAGIVDGDFYLADMLSEDNYTLKEKLFVLLKNDHYELDRKLNELGLFTFSMTAFKDKQKAHVQFWNKYQRPPKKDYWDYIVERRDLLVPQDIRERKGSFFTPQIWVELSQKYLGDVLGEDWQDDYYIWDCAAGTGNLLTGLTNKYHIWASTLDRQDVDVMKDRISNGANLLEDHVFQFDFLNDDFDKLPKPLLNIINDPEKRKKLVVYINPPYAEAPTRIFRKSGKRAVEQSKINKKYAKILGQGNRELFIQFITRIYFEIEGAIIAEFSTLKILQGQHFVSFRNLFLAKLEKIFIVPSTTFDNVRGHFPIAFMIWNTHKKEKFKTVKSDVYDKKGIFQAIKNLNVYNSDEYINDWIKPFRANKSDNHIIGKFPFMGNDFQQQNIIQINHINMVYNKAAGQFLINKTNLIKSCIYFAVRKCIKATWLNDRDQFLYPNERWKIDSKFQNNCLTYTLFNNNIQSEYGTNHWIPFTEYEVDSREKFDSSFMTDFIKGKLKPIGNGDLLNKQKYRTKALVFSAEAKAVFESGKKLWKYYHKEKKCNVNASLYDIRAHFQGKNAKCKMNSKSQDQTYMTLITDLRSKLDNLAKKIEPKIYDYEFLKK